jgi:hypothetical protein
MRAISIAMALAVGAAGCAQRSEDVRAASVSPILYQHLTCLQIAQEAARVSSKAIELSGAQDQRATNDAVATGVALVIFWPAAFFVRGDGANAAELSRLKGEMEALEMVSRQKNCGIQFARQSPPPRQATTGSSNRP